MHAPLVSMGSLMAAAPVAAVIARTVAGAAAMGVVPVAVMTAATAIVNGALIRICG